LASLAGVDEPRAWAMRAATVARCPEALDSIRGLDGPAAWDLRAHGQGPWPVAAVKSLGPLALTERGRAFLAEQLVRLPDSLALWRSAALVVSRSADADDE
jgi:dTMP kinase